MSTQLRITRGQIQAKFNEAGCASYWRERLYSKLDGLVILQMVGNVYHDLVAHTDVRMMTYGQQAFVKMVIDFPSAWRSQILVNDKWSDMSALLQVNWARPVDPADVVFIKPPVEQKPKTKIKPCSSCGVFTAIGCAVDGSRLCQKCCYRHGLASVKMALSEKSQVQLFNRIRSKLAGCKLGSTQWKSKLADFGAEYVVKVVFKVKLPPKSCISARNYLKNDVFYDVKATV